MKIDNRIRNWNKSLQHFLDSFQIEHLLPLNIEKQSWSLEWGKITYFAKHFLSRRVYKGKNNHFCYDTNKNKESHR